MNKNKVIDEVMGQIDFGRIRDVMVHLDRTWGDDVVPSIYRLMKSAEELLSEVYDNTERSMVDGESVSSGGFVASGYWAGGEVSLQLSF